MDEQSSGKPDMPVWRFHTLCVESEKPFFEKSRHAPTTTHACPPNRAPQLCPAVRKEERLYRHIEVLK